MSPTDSSHMPDVELSKHSLPPAGEPHNDTSISPISSAQATDISYPAPSKRSQASHQLYSKKKPDGAISLLCQWTVEHQVGLSANLLLLHALAHVFLPRARETTAKFNQLSYQNPITGHYAVGWDDFYMVIYFIVVLTGLRAAALDYLLIPLANAFGIAHRKDRIRFAEQGWILIYNSFVCPLELYILYNSKYWMNFQELWTEWPTRELSAMMKWYYLLQFSFWLQQIVTVNIEKRRKDHWQMFTHHVVTCILMFTSYGYHYTKVGNLIMCLMDVVDIFLALAKILKYLNFQLACDVAFGIFMVVWFVARHCVYMAIIFSIFQHVPGKVIYGCYKGGADKIIGPFQVDNEFQHLLEPFHDPSGTICFNDSLKWAFVATLLSLQVLLIMWFVMIIRVAIKVISGTGADDTRSDTEDDVEEDEEDDMIEASMPKSKRIHSKIPAVEEKLVNRITSNNPSFEDEVEQRRTLATAAQRMSPVRRFRKGGGVASGVTIPSDTKELLGRIGCDGGHD